MLRALVEFRIRGVKVRFSPVDLHPFLKLLIDKHSFPLSFADA
jgi:hypothetical protein